ncbi:MAG TPA: response regulator transcription factor [Thiobacillaceae bacterium]|nr:response regulator transcription factor [Thiobacillaceae bacterium]HNI08664.1 response regulator transcription factor [Thiobacillaceae bacterium]
MGRNVLVIEDERQIADVIKLNLQQQLDCKVKLALDGHVGLTEAEARSWDLIILDIMLPGVDGLEILRRVRAKSRSQAVLMLTAKSTELDRVLGLELGADDYLTKPFSMLELIARVKAAFRRMDALTAGGGDGREQVSIAGLTLDPVRRTVTLDGQELDLTAKEFDLIWFFARNPGRVYSRTQVLDAVWGYSHSGYEHTVNTHINRLRSKLEKDPAQPEYLLTVWGVGYKFREA